MLARSGWAAAVLAAVFVCAPHAARAVVIDDFTQGPIQLTAYDFSIDAVTQQLSPFLDVPLGGARQWELGSTVVNEPGVFGSRITVEPFDDVFRFEAGPSNFGYLDLRYESGEEETFDLVGDGNDRFRFRFVGEQNVPQLSVQIESLVGGEVVSAWATLGPNRVIVPPDAILEVPFEAFFGEVDFGHVLSITFSNVRYAPGNQFTLDLIETAPAPLVGDYDRDGDVDEADGEFWQASYGGLLRETGFGSGEFEPFGFPYPGLSVDGNGDGFIDAADYTVWRTALDDVAAGTVVPEPAGLAVAVLGLLPAALGPGRRRRAGG